MQFLRSSSLTLLRHLRWNSSHEVVQDLVNVFEHNRWHCVELARWQQCHLALSIPTLSIWDTSNEGEFCVSSLVGERKHCQNLSYHKKKSLNATDVNKIIKCSWTLTWSNGVSHPPICKPLITSWIVVDLWDITSLQFSLHFTLLDLSQQCISERPHYY